MNPNSPNQQAPGMQAPPGVPYIPQQGAQSTAMGTSMPSMAGTPTVAIHPPLASDLIRQNGLPPNVQMAAPGALNAAPIVPGQPSAPPVVHTNPNSTQNTLLIAEIRDGIVIMNDGSFRSVIMVKSVNFDLMSPQEQESVEYAYQGFLNSLFFPVQIFIRSQKVDLQPYINKLDKIRSEHDNMLLAMLMADYIDYISQLSQVTNIMDKKFYIVIPYFPHVDVQKAITQSKNFFTGIVNLFNAKEQHVVVNEADLEKAKSELRNRVQSVLSGLLQCSIQGLPLDTQELIELYYDTYNPDTATRQKLKNFGDLDSDVITKGAGVAPQAHLQRELN